MGKINFNDADFETPLPVQVGSSTELATCPYNPSPIPANPPGNLLQPLTMMTPAGAALSVINGAFGVIGEISRCIATVSVEKQKTKQVREAVRGQIEESKQRTKRISVQQKEETKRFEAECRYKLDVAKLDLERLKEEIRRDEAKLNSDHQVFLKTLDALSKVLDSLLDEKREVYRELLSVTDAEQRTSALQRLDNINNQLVQLSDRIIALKRS